MLLQCYDRLLIAHDITAYSGAMKLPDYDHNASLRLPDAGCRMPDARTIAINLEFASVVNEINAHLTTELFGVSMSQAQSHHTHRYQYE